MAPADEAAIAGAEEVASSEGEAPDAAEALSDAADEPELTDEQLLARSLGIELPSETSASSESSPEADTVVEVEATPVVEPVATGSFETEPLHWGVRLLAIVPRTQPPRAVLGLVSGEEVVVEPGSFVPDARVVVLAVGSDAVQVAYVEPHGDRTHVRTETLLPLHASAARSEEM